MTNFRRTVVLALALLSALLASGQAPQQSESFYSKSQRAIVQLQYIQTIYDPTEHRNKLEVHNATGFFVKNGIALYVVTAGHVARESFSFIARISILLKDGSLLETRLTMPHDDWVLSPEEGDLTHYPVDVAVMKIADHGGLMAFNYCPSKCSAGEQNQLAEDGEPPAPVMVFGFPLDVPGLKLLRPVPLGRQGIIGLIDSKEDEIEMEGKYFDRRGFIIDIPTLAKGNSGSPVMSATSFLPLRLFGIISGISSAGGFAVAEPVSRIKELLDNSRTESMQPVDTWCLLNAADLKKVDAPVCQ